MAGDALLAVEVPIIDLAQDEAAAAAQVRAACMDVGFFYVNNHGVDSTLIVEEFDQNKKLFALPTDEKKKILADKNNRGYTPFQEEVLDPDNQSQGDTKEGFYFGREVPADSPEASKPLHGPNQWPDPQLLPDFRPITEKYFEAMRGLGMRLLRLLALALDLPAHHFDADFDRPVINLRPLRYAPVKSNPGDGIYGAGAHTDYGMITILATDGVGGLQIHHQGVWKDVPHVEGTFIINLGDMLERWTNGLFRSTLHRVLGTGQERYSIAFFFEPNFDAVVECLPQCCVDRPAKYPPTTSGQHLLDKYAQTHKGYSGPVKSNGIKA